jgi:DNA-binding NarL/FixJ family response regulator
VSLLLTDVVLPGGSSGFDLAEKARERRPNLKVLFMSGYTEIARITARQTIEEAGLINKPFRKSELAERIRAVLDK